MNRTMKVLRYRSKKIVDDRFAFAYKWRFSTSFVRCALFYVLFLSFCPFSSLTATVLDDEKRVLELDLSAFSEESGPFFILISDSTTINQLNEKANNLLLKNAADSAFYFAFKAHQQSELLDYTKGKIRSMLIMARANKINKAYAEALSYYLQVERIFSLQKNTKQLLMVRQEVGALYSDWGVKEKSLEYYLAAYAIMDEHEKEEKRILLLEKISECYLSLNEYLKAVESFQEILAIEKKLGNPRKVLGVLSNISTAYIQSKNHIKALQTELEMLSIRKQIQDEVEVANSLNNIGFLYKHLGDHDLALVYFKESLNYNRRLNPLGLPNVAEKKILINIGIIYHSIGDYKKSLKYHFEALQSWVSKGSALEIAEIYNKIAFNYLMLNDYKKAIDYAETGLSLAEEGGNEIFLAQSYKAISELYHKTGNDRKALQYYQRYAGINEDLSEAQLERQEELVQKQFVIERKENDLKQVIAEKELRELELNKLHLETEKREKDIELLLRDKALQDISLRHQRSEKERVEQALSLAKSQLEMEARDNKIALLRTNDSIQGLALTQKILEERERAKDIALLKQQKANQQMILDEQKTYRQIIYGVLVLMLVIICLVIKSYFIKKKANKKLALQNREIQSQKEQIEQQKDGLEQAYDNIKLLSEIAKDINSNLSIEKISAVVYKNINVMMDATAFGIGIYNEPMNTIEIPGAFEKGGLIPKISISLDDKNRLGAWSFNNQKVVFINDYTKEYKKFIAEIPPALINDNSESIMYVPLLVKEKCIGILTVQSPQKNAYTEFHLNLLLNLAVYIAIAVENAKAYQLIEEKTDALQDTLRELRAAQMQLIQSEKMASLGHLTAGIAHEINNPINFVFAGVDSIHESMEDLLKILYAYEKLDGEVEIDKIKQTVLEVGELKERLMFEKTVSGLNKVLNAIKEGALRTAEIVKGLRYFSRLDESELRLADIHSGIDNTLIILSSKIKEKNIFIKTIYDRNLLAIKGYPGQLNQVFMNIIGNAIEAVPHGGTITIKTVDEKRHVLISISDNGKGIPPNIQNRIFEPFFTTKELGHGTGLGLSISYGIIEKHKGIIEIISEEEKGATFAIRLPKSETSDNDFLKLKSKSLEDIPSHV